MTAALPGQVYTTETPADDTPAPVAAADQGDNGTATPDAPEGADTLGDPGKRAIDAMKAERNAAKAEARAAKQEAEELRARLSAKDKTPDEQAIEAARRAATAEATAKANDRIRRSEIRAAAAGKLADPADALAYLDLSRFDVSDDGEIDADAVNDAIADLLQRKPYLGAAKAPTGPRPDPAQGARPQSTQAIEDAEYAAFKARLFPSNNTEA